MDVEFFRPFVEGTIKTLKVQASVEAKAAKPFYKERSPQESIEIAAIIGLASDVFSGTIAVCYPRAVFLHIMKMMLDEEYEEITDDLQDGAAELLNIIYGHAKVVLNEKGYGIQKAIPTVVRGKDLETTHLTSEQKVVVLPFETEAGVFYIEISTEAKSM